jgi:hypothetical protein
VRLVFWFKSTTVLAVVSPDDQCVNVNPFLSPAVTTKLAPPESVSAAGSDKVVARRPEGATSAVKPFSAVPFGSAAAICKAYVTGGGGGATVVEEEVVVVVDVLVDVLVELVNSAKISAKEKMVVVKAVLSADAIEGALKPGK